MKHFLLLLLIFFTLSCHQSTNHETEKAIEIDPVNNTNAAKPDISLNNDTPDKSRLIPKITLDPNDSLIDIIDTNLDLDSHDEQILIVKNNSVNDSRLRILVADFDDVLDSYSLAWEAVTESNNIPSFSINLIDITGDHNLEIVCSGNDLDGRETLNIFRRTPSVNRFALHFSEIIKLKVDGTIDIKEEQRSQAYQSGTSGGISFPVIVTKRDPDSENILDLTQETYFWRNDESAYKLINVDKIPGAEIENIKLKELYREGKNYFKNHLNGPWMLSSTDNDISYNNPVVFFDSDNREIIFYNNDYQEIYTWENSSKILSNTLLISSKNELVPFLDVSIFVRIVDLNTIHVRFRDNSLRNNRSSDNQAWTGTYFKLGDAVQRTIIDDYRTIDSKNDVPVLSGYYRSDTGDEIFFDSPDYTLKTNEKVINGGFYLFNNGLQIAEFKSLDSNGIPIQTSVYKYDYFEEINETEIFRTIILVPGELTITGFKPSGENFIRFQQIEQIEIPEESLTTTF